jgi:hypothetical protein
MWWILKVFFNAGDESKYSVAALVFNDRHRIGIQESKKINEMPTFWETMLLLTLSQDFVQFFVFEKLLDSV